MWVIIRQVMSGDWNLSSDTCLQTLVRAVVVLTFCHQHVAKEGAFSKWEIKSWKKDSHLFETWVVKLLI